MAQQEEDIVPIALAGKAVSFSDFDRDWEGEAGKMKQPCAGQGSFLLT
ncbi:MAG: hypothetical protein ACXWNF_05770 [Isosphaeraceae bacterium]